MLRALFLIYIIFWLLEIDVVISTLDQLQKYNKMVEENSKKLREKLEAKTDSIQRLKNLMKGFKNFLKKFRILKFFQKLTKCFNEKI